MSSMLSPFLFFLRRVIHNPLCCPPFCYLCRAQQPDSSVPELRTVTRIRGTCIHHADSYIRLYFDIVFTSTSQLFSCAFPFSFAGRNSRFRQSRSCEQ